MDLWQSQHFPALSLKNYQLWVIVQNANIPMIALKKKIPNNKQPKKKKKGGKEKPNCSSSRGKHSRKPKNETVEISLLCLLWAAASLGHV